MEPYVFQSNEQGLGMQFKPPAAGLDREEEHAHRPGNFIQ